MPAERKIVGEVAFGGGSEDYNYIIMEYDTDGNLIYVGQHKTLDAPTSDPNWKVTKFIYDADGNIIEIRKATMAWDDRGSL